MPVFLFLSTYEDIAQSLWRLAIARCAWFVCYLSLFQVLYYIVHGLNEADSIKMRNCITKSRALVLMECDLCRSDRMCHHMHVKKTDENV